MTAQLEHLAATSGSASKAVRTSVLIHPELDLASQNAAFLTLPHPRTHVPTYYLCATVDGRDQLLELGSLAETKLDRSWFISGSLASPTTAESPEMVISRARLEMLTPVDVRFLVISILDGLTGSGDDAGVFREAEDAFEQAAAHIYRSRKDELTGRVAAYKANGDDGSETTEEEWTDILTFANTPMVKEALRQVTDIQNLYEDEQSKQEAQVMYRLSRSKIYDDMLAPKLANLSKQSTFAQSPNILSATFVRRWPHPSDPTMHISVSDAAITETPETRDATRLRRQIAAEIIASYLPATFALEWFRYLGLPTE